MIKMDNPMAKVEGKSYEGEIPIEFALSIKEIKHLRRTLRLYDLIHPKAYKTDDSLSRTLHSKFAKFGKINRRHSSDKRKVLIKGLTDNKKCSYAGCAETEGLELHHLNPVSNSDNPNDLRNVRLLCHRHHLQIELEGILRRKLIEVDKLREKITTLLKGGTNGETLLKDELPIESNNFDETSGEETK